MPIDLAGANRLKTYSARVFALSKGDLARGRTKCPLETSISSQLYFKWWAFGAPDTIRTCGLRLRRATLYPAELRVHLLLTQCLREFLASVKRRAAFSQVFVFRTSFELLFCTN
jgi:hypothetical protein